MTITINGTTGITSPGGDLSVSQGLSGNLNFTGTGNRITGDFSNATVASRVLLQSSTTNGQSALGLLPNGTSTQTQYLAFNSTDPANSSYIQALISATEARINSGQLGTGTNLPMAFYTGGSERVRIDTSGNVGIGTTSNLASSKLDVRGRIRTGTGNSSGDAEVVWSNYASATSAWNLSVRQDVGGANNDLKFLRFDSSGAYQGIAMQIDSAAGNVGIGTSAPASKLEVTGDVQQTWAASMDRFVGSKFSTTYELGVHFLESSRETRLVSKAADSTGLISFYTGVTPTERMRINSDGTLLVLTTVAPATSWNTNSRVNIKAGVQLTHTGNANTWRQLSWSGDTADTTLFFPSQAGNVPSLSAAGAWTNASDGRLKTNVRTIEHGLASVIAAKPRSYTRTDCAGNYIGFVAQELKEIIPEVVLGSEETQYGVDYGSLVAVAFKAIQEQQTMIEELCAEIQLLKTQ